MSLSINLLPGPEAGTVGCVASCPKLLTDSLFRACLLALLPQFVSSQFDSEKSLAGGVRGDYSSAIER
jgi:hypothetical protein